MNTASVLAHKERVQVERANQSGKKPVVFIHGLWLLSTSWQRWIKKFESAGYSCVAAAWPDDPDTVQQAAEDPQVFADKTIGMVADHLSEVIDDLENKPLLIGHSFGGLLAQMLAGRGLSDGTVAISPAPFRGVLPLPLSALKSAWPVLGNPANRHRSVALTYPEFRYAFANAVDEAEAQALYAEFAVPAPGAPLFQAATANFNPWTEASVDTGNLLRGPLLILAGESDHTVPPAVCHAAYKIQMKNPGVTEYSEIAARGHALTIDGGWLEVADRALEFLRRTS